MGHEFVYRSYHETVDKCAVETEMNKIAERESDCGGGLNNSIRWINIPPLPNYEAAERYINEHDHGWYDQLAVRYISDEKAPKPTKAYLDLKKKVDDAQKKYEEMESNIHYKSGNVKSSFISCPHCDSKLSTKYIRSNLCALCGYDLRPKTTLDAICAAEKKVLELKKRLRIATDELQKRPKTEPIVKWLVKVEYHV